MRITAHSPPAGGWILDHLGSYRVVAQIENAERDSFYEKALIGAIMKVRQLASTVSPGFSEPGFATVTFPT